MSTYGPGVLSTSRRLSAEQTSARLMALTPRWVPTPEVVADELRRIDQGGPDGLTVVEPSPLRDVDLVPERRRLPALLVLLAGGLVGSVTVWLLAVPRGEAAPPVSVSAPVTTLAAQSPSPGPSTSLSTSPSVIPTTGSSGVAPGGSAGVVVVDVQGAVHRPGVVELPVGSRVVDALAAAGGTTRRAVTVTLNLAQVLVDGTQVLVPDRRSTTAVTAPTSGAASGGSPAPGAPVDLNTATLEQLDALPGIGPVLAQRILDYRSQHGPFTSVDQLTDVSGIGDATMADLAPLVRV